MGDRDDCTLTPIVPEFCEREQRGTRTRNVVATVKLVRDKSLGERPISVASSQQIAFDVYTASR